MNKKPLKYIEFTISELQQFVNDKNSCVKRINTEMHLAFPPWGISNFKEYLTGLVRRKKIGRYDEKIGGIILDVRNIKVQGNQFAVQDDSANLHVNLVADFYVFMPTLNCMIQGTIKHIAPKHISVILYRLFNVTIKINGKQDLQINSDVFVKITDFNLSYTIPSIHGELCTDLNANSRTLKFNEMTDASGNSSSDEDTDSEAENRRHKQILQQEIVNGIKIKQERPSSGSDDSSDDNEDATMRNTKKRQSSSESDSHSSHSRTSRSSDRDSDSTSSSGSQSECSMAKVKQEKSSDNGLGKKRKFENGTIKVEKDLPSTVVKIKREKKMKTESVLKSDLQQEIMKKIVSKFK